MSDTLRRGPGLPSTMRHSLLAPLLLLAALTAPVALSQCPEPSALDLRPAAEPLRVEKSGSRDLRVSWESVMADGFRLHRGRLDRLFANEAYDHRVLVETALNETTLEDSGNDSYFLVNANCRASESGVGRDSTGVERPWGGLLLISVGLQGGAGVNGSQFTLQYPIGEAFTDEDGVGFVGPYEQGAPGSPFGAINANDDGLVRAAVVFAQFSPDPSFDPPPDEPISIAEIRFGYHGTPPLVDAFSLVVCASSDNQGNGIPEVLCLISGYEVLP